PARAHGIVRVPARGGSQAAGRDRPGRGGRTRAELVRFDARLAEPDVSTSGSQRTGAQILWEALHREGVEVVFGYPGGAIMPAYDALLDSPIRHVLVRHEQ